MFFFKRRVHNAFNMISARENLLYKCPSPLFGILTIHSVERVWAFMWKYMDKISIPTSASQVYHNCTIERCGQINRTHPLLTISNITKWLPNYCYCLCRKSAPVLIHFFSLCPPFIDSALFNSIFQAKVMALTHYIKSVSLYVESW